MRIWIPVVVALLLNACISPDNETFEGTGTPDITGCGSIPGVLDGATYVAQGAQTFAIDNRQHPDIFYLGWSTLDGRADLRFPARGYSGTGFEDKLLVSRNLPDGTVDTWQLLPKLDANCQDIEKIRIHSFDMAPDGQSLYLSMRRDDHPKLAIYEFNINSYSFSKLTNDDSADFMYPTYVGDDASNGHRMLFVAKTVTDDEVPVNYKAGNYLLDEYDRAHTPLIHSLDTETGDLFRIGFNNSHQTDPVAITRPDGTRLVVFTQWEHQQTTNRFSLWKMQVDGSDNFTFYGQESRTDRSGADVFQAREVKSGPYQGYILATQGGRTNFGFAAEGHILMTERVDLDLRSAPLFLSRVNNSSGSDVGIARTPDHYNDQSFVYAFRDSVDIGYGIYVKDYPASPAGDVTGNGPGTLMIADANYHFVQPRSFYPPASAVAAPGEGDLGESRTSFTNTALNGKSGFLVQNLVASDNGVQHQLDGLDPSEVSMQFYIPSQTFVESRTIGVGNSAEMTIPASNFIQPEADGSFAAILKNGLYVWKVHKRFNLGGNDIWVPVRAERQEISFVPDRVNACNQCHQERDQANIDLYSNYNSTAAQKVQGDLSGVADASYYDASASVPDFHADIMPMFTTPGAGGQSCADCHDARDKLNLSNSTGPEARSSAWRTLVSGAHQLPSGNVVPYVSSSINPMGMDDNYHAAPFLWSLLLDDDLTVPPEAGFPDSSSRNLSRAGDYGATYDTEIEQAIIDINAQYDHSSHWSPADVQKFITYTTTQVPVGLSDRISFVTEGAGYLESAAGQKAYQAMVRNCFNCHNNHITEGVDAAGFGLPLEKRFSGSTDIKSRQLRFVVWSHLANKADTAFSPYIWQSNLNTAMYRSLESARYRIDFANPDESELLVYARADNLHANVSHPVVLGVGDPDYIALQDWVSGLAAANQPPVVDAPLAPLTFAEYDEPAWHGPLTWSDPDGDLSQLILQGSSSAEHSANDSMMALDYQDFNSAMVQTYAILGDRGNHQIEVTVTDGQQNSAVQTVPVTITTDYIVPKPEPTLPNAYVFYTVRETGELRKLDTDGTDVGIGVIAGYSTDFTTVYRRSDRGWLYFFSQAQQRVTVVDETNANVVFSINLDHTPNQETATHKQTVYLLWWRPADGLSSSSACNGVGELQAVMESKLSETKNGDFYVGLGCDEPAPGSSVTVVPEYRTKLPDGGNTISVYVWRKATFMSKWAVESIDRMNVLNLVTGKPKALTDYSFAAKNYAGSDYLAQDYHNVRAVVLAEDGAFYGFNKDLNSPVTLFNFDPIEGVQVEVPMPNWMHDYFNNPLVYATPFLVIEPRTP